MKIKFGDNTEGILEIRHQYEGCNQVDIDVFTEAIQKYQETIASLSLLGELSPGGLTQGAKAEVAKLIEWYRQEICTCKGVVAVAKQQPISATSWRGIWNGRCLPNAIHGRQPQQAA